MIVSKKNFHLTDYVLRLSAKVSQPCLTHPIPISYLNLTLYCISLTLGTNVDSHCLISTCIHLGALIDKSLPLFNSSHTWLSKKGLASLPFSYLFYFVVSYCYKVYHHTLCITLASNWIHPYRHLFPVPRA